MVGKIKSQGNSTLALSSETTVDRLRAGTLECWWRGPFLTRSLDLRKHDVDGCGLHVTKGDAKKIRQLLMVARPKRSMAQCKCA